MSAADKSQQMPWIAEDGRRFNHVRIDVQLYRDKRLDSLSKSVYGGIVIHAELATGKAFPGMELLAKYAQCSERAASDRVAILEAVGYIEVSRVPGKSNRYRLLPPPELPAEFDVTPTPARDAGVQVGDFSTTHEPPAGVPLQEVHGTPERGSGNPRRRFGRPPNHVPTNKNQLTRTINKDARGADLSTGSRFPAPRKGCAKCDAGWVELDDGSLTPCNDCKVLTA